MDTNVEAHVDQAVTLITIDMPTEPQERVALAQAHATIAVAKAIVNLTSEVEMIGTRLGWK